MARYFLNPGVFAVIVADDLIVLDVGKDSYSCLSLPGEAIRLDAENAAIECGPDIGETLCDASLASRTSPPQRIRRRAPPALPSRTLVIPAVPTSSVADIAALAQTWIGLVGSPRTLGAMLREVEPTQSQDPSAEGLTKRVATYRRYLPALPYVGRCLFQCRLLRRYLHQAGLPTTWVFGVRTYPFAAHCWLQCGDMALTDAPETLADLHPIMAV